MKCWMCGMATALALAAATVVFSAPLDRIVIAPPVDVAATAPVTESGVEIDNFTFKPKEITIVVGSKVTWVNKDDVPHTATSSDDTPVFDSKALDTDEKFTFTFTKPGTYKYFCKVHPHMTGIVIVK